MSKETKVSMERYARPATAHRGAAQPQGLLLTKGCKELPDPQQSHFQKYIIYPCTCHKKYKTPQGVTAHTHCIRLPDHKKTHLMNTQAATITSHWEGPDRPGAFEGPAGWRAGQAPQPAGRPQDIKSHCTRAKISWSQRRWSRSGSWVFLWLGTEPVE